ncbi:MAG: class I SAM-dependent methyltransferase [Anaerolineales bacterium]|nr:class I SAM-dependent methyltransferase [Anaerolineales bacterium]
MDLAVAQRLAALNQAFYEDHAEDFADTRPRLPAGVSRVLGRVARGTRVLEVGCGDGKVGRALARAGAAGYLGLDVSEAMLARARRYTGAEALPVPLAFQRADLMDPAWPGALPAQPFDWVLAFGVFHHLPGAARRAQVFGALAARLAADGHLALANWQFTRSERLSKRQVGWEAVGLTVADVEPGDALLPWERRGRTGLRFVHLLDAAEAQQLAANTGLRVRETFSADGASGDLNEYWIMGRERSKAGNSRARGDSGEEPRPWHGCELVGG